MHAFMSKNHIYNNVEAQICEKTSTWGYNDASNFLFEIIWETLYKNSKIKRFGGGWRSFEEFCGILRCFEKTHYRRIDGPTDGRMDGPTDGQTLI